MRGSTLALASVAGLAGLGLLRRGSRSVVLAQPRPPRVAVLRKKYAWHVGVRDAEQKRDAWRTTHPQAQGRNPGGSYEGEGLSVSEHPEAWTKIARLGGHVTHELARADGTTGRFADMRKLLYGPQAPALEALLQARGDIVPGEPAYAFDHEVSDEYGERTETQVFATRTEAEFEAEDLEVDPDTIYAYPQWAASPAIQARWRQHFAGDVPPGQVVDYATLCWLEASFPDLDGAWWTEDLDPQALSAPRGVIFPSRLDRWTWGPEAHRTRDWEW